MWAFTTTALVFTSLLITASVVVSKARSEAIRPLRMAGPAVKRWSGHILVAVGAWFILLAALPCPIPT